MKQLKKASRLIIRRKPFSFLLTVIVLAIPSGTVHCTVYTVDKFLSELGLKKYKPRLSYNDASTVYVIVNKIQFKKKHTVRAINIVKDGSPHKCFLGSLQGLPGGSLGASQYIYTSVTLQKIPGSFLGLPYDIDQMVLAVENY